MLALRVRHIEAFAPARELLPGVVRQSPQGRRVRSLIVVAHDLANSKARKSFAAETLDMPVTAHRDDIAAAAWVATDALLPRCDVTIQPTQFRPLSGAA